ncbi:hypothetical protein DFS33DRAFT_1276708 [Desarmillaria ectypa]|nr:hypothetical protein DFS33DRAFT_1276708 [Desarmillaria ectypa]
MRKHNTVVSMAVSPINRTNKTQTLPLSHPFKKTRRVADIRIRHYTRFFLITTQKAPPYTHAPSTVSSSSAATVTTAGSSGSSSGTNVLGIGTVTLLTVISIIFFRYRPIQFYARQAMGCADLCLMISHARSEANLDGNQTGVTSDK